MLVFTLFGVSLVGRVAEGYPTASSQELMDRQVACGNLTYGISVCPDRALTAETSAAVIPPDAFKS